MPPCYRCIPVLGSVKVKDDGVKRKKYKDEEETEKTTNAQTKETHSTNIGYTRHNS